MDGDEDGNSRISVEEFPSFFNNTDQSPQDRLCGSCTQAHDHLWTNGCEFRLQPRVTGDDLPDERLLVHAALAALNKFKMFHGIRDVDFFTGYAGLSECFVEYAARRSRKRTTLTILYVARLFTDKHYLCFSWTFAVNRLARVLVQIASFAAKSGGAQARERATLW
jgi:hypothetical protein